MKIKKICDTMRDKVMMIMKIMKITGLLMMTILTLITDNNHNKVDINWATTIHKLDQE